MDYFAPLSRTHIHPRLSGQLAVNGVFDSIGISPGIPVNFCCCTRHQDSRLLLDLTRTPAILSGPLILITNSDLESRSRPASLIGGVGIGPSIDVRARQADTQATTIQCTHALARLKQVKHTTRSRAEELARASHVGGDEDESHLDSERSRMRGAESRSCQRKENLRAQDRAISAYLR
jgi:hypothetical protein